jgi:hypothetical protein
MVKRVLSIAEIERHLLRLGCDPEQAALHVRRLMTCKKKKPVDHSVALRPRKYVLRHRKHGV